MIIIIIIILPFIIITATNYTKCFTATTTTITTSTTNTTNFFFCFFKFFFFIFIFYFCGEMSACMDVGGGCVYTVFYFFFPLRHFEFCFVIKMIDFWSDRIPTPFKNKTFLFYPFFIKKKKTKQNEKQNKMWDLYLFVFFSPHPTIPIVFLVFFFKFSSLWSK